MFVILATKPTQDGCKGFRFNFLGNKGIYRKRSLYLEKAAPKRKLCHFAG